MLYTTLERAKAAVGIKADPAPADSARLLALAASIGAALEAWCRRRFTIARETVTLPTYPGATVYVLPQAPIRAVHAVRFDASGLFTSSETIDDFRFDGGALVVDALPESRRGLQVDYTAGLVGSFDTLGLAVTASGAIAQGAAVTVDGATIGTVASYADGALVLAQTQGQVRPGDTLTIGAAPVTATVTAISSPSVLNDAPEIEQALLLQLTEVWHRRAQVGRSGTQAGQAGSINWMDELKLGRMTTELVGHLRRWA